MVRELDKELGIRIALGAPPSTALHMVMKYGISLAALGAALGIVGASRRDVSCQRCCMGFGGMTWQPSFSRHSSLYASRCWRAHTPRSKQRESTHYGFSGQTEIRRQFPDRVGFFTAALEATRTVGGRTPSNGVTHFRDQPGMSSSSTSNINVAFGPITGPLPASP